MNPRSGRRQAPLRRYCRNSHSGNHRGRTEHDPRELCDHWLFQKSAFPTRLIVFHQSSGIHPGHHSSSQQQSRHMEKPLQPCQPISCLGLLPLVPGPGHHLICKAVTRSCLRPLQPCRQHRRDKGLSRPAQPWQRCQHYCQIPKNQPQQRKGQQANPALFSEVMSDPSQQKGSRTHRRPQPHGETSTVFGHPLECFQQGSF